jgi:hypothetical protein
MRPVAWRQQLPKDDGNADVTDAGMLHLQKLTKLRWLRLENTHVSDKGLAQLSGLTALQWVAVPKTQVTAAGVAELQRALPALKIDK